MNLTLACVGTRMPGWIAQGWQEYARRMPQHLDLSLLEFASAGKAGAGRETIIEAERLLSRVPDQAHCIALHGATAGWSTEKLASRLGQWQHNGKPVWFFIGGAQGLDAAVLQRCAEKWSLGPAVFPHMLVRVIVAEQLYRASSILAGHPYHRA